MAPATMTPAVLKPQPLGDCHPMLERRVERALMVETPFVDAARVAPIQHIDANGEKAFPTRRDQPRHALLCLDLPLRVRCQRELGTGMDRAGMRDEQHNRQQTVRKQAHER